LFFLDARNTTGIGDGARCSGFQETPGPGSLHSGLDVSIGYATVILITSLPADLRARFPQVKRPEISAWPVCVKFHLGFPFSLPGFPPVLLFLLKIPGFQHLPFKIERPFRRPFLGPTDRGQGGDDRQ